MIIDTNTHLGSWPFRRPPWNETADIVKKLKGVQITEAWAGSFDRRHALGQLLIGARDIANMIMNRARAIEADHHIIAAPHQLGSMAAQPQLTRLAARSGHAA